MNGDLTDGSIILMHDIHEPSVQAADQDDSGTRAERI